MGRLWGHRCPSISTMRMGSSRSCADVPLTASLAVLYLPSPAFCPSVPAFVWKRKPDFFALSISHPLDPVVVPPPQLWSRQASQSWGLLESRPVRSFHQHRLEEAQLEMVGDVALFPNQLSYPLLSFLVSPHSAPFPFCFPAPTTIGGFFSSWPLTLALTNMGISKHPCLLLPPPPHSQSPCGLPTPVRSQA